jgi:hypothetical protein
MKKPKFKMGQNVFVDPTGRGRGDMGKVIGVTHWIDGSIGYIVSVAGIAGQAVIRHSLSESEIMAVPEVQK